MKIYLICPVTIATEESTKFAKEYVAELEQNQYHEVFYPQRDVEQNDPTGLNLVNTELQAIRECDEVHVIWDKDSKGSHFDLGVAMGLNKPIILVKSLKPDVEGKSYEKVIRIKAEEYSKSQRYLW